VPFSKKKKKIFEDHFYLVIEVPKPETSSVKEIYKWQPYINRPVGRPKHRWDDDVTNDLRKMKLLNPLAYYFL